MFRIPSGCVGIAAYCTVNFVLLVAVPPFVVTPIFPVAAPEGTMAVICVSEFTVKLAATLPNFTLVAWVRLTTVMTTGVPAVPCGGEKLFT